jgi:serine/threonine protein kinase
LQQTLEQSIPDLYGVLTDPIVVEPDAKLLGHGNYGAVFLGRVGEVLAAVKMLNPEGKQSQREVDDLNHEIAMMHMLYECGAHPHLVRLLEAESGTHPKLALELAAHGDLKHYLDTLTHLDPETWGACAVYFAAQIAQGMALLEKCTRCSFYASIFVLGARGCLKVQQIGVLRRHCEAAASSDVLNEFNSLHGECMSTQSV